MLTVCLTRGFFSPLHLWSFPNEWFDFEVFFLILNLYFQKGVSTLFFAVVCLVPQSNVVGGALLAKENKKAAVGSGEVPCEIVFLFFSDFLNG